MCVCEVQLGNKGRKEGRKEGKPDGGVSEMSE